ncbi:MAG: hypothetical protein QN141_02790 [Armatimonadota bacterium]|nr:hypothetical protein [Armatimonadota bacterium]MDR7452579.1 hypothetical protein [Armatimonadota bacterium]MDR7468206.1 hypothetical protein [Armatimonadota bacterium]MDR7495066.1 hypothetical protein [Armatimonadota bacterium]MDR7500114.1 hypothetical protein [Armatimonadota bacterium]
MSHAAPRIRYTAGLQEAVVELLLRRRAEAGDAALYEPYRRAADRIYVQHVRPEDRRQAFRLLSARFFEILGGGRPVTDAAGALPPQVDEIIVSRAWSRTEEGADLGRDRRTVGVRLRPARFEAPADLTRFLRHEFGHIVDVLDETFGYGEGLPDPAGAGRPVGEQFRFLWDCSVDGRAVRAGNSPWRTRAEYEEAGVQIFAWMPAPAARAIVTRLWDGDRPTYPMLLRLASDRAALAAFAGVAVEEGDPPPPAGGRCPLCRFPTYEWATTIEEAVAARIRTDFPDWHPRLKACARCVEGYAVSLQGVLSGS